MNVNQSAINQNPTTWNHLSPLNFRLLIKRAPDTNYTVQEINIPGISMAPAYQQTPYIAIPKPGDHLDFEPLVITFKVDENFQNYIEISKWLRSLGRLPDAKAYKELQQQPRYTGEGVLSEIVLGIYDASKVPNVSFIFHDAFPISISNLQFTDKDETVNYINATAMFRYAWYDIERENTIVPIPIVT